MNFLWETFKLDIVPTGKVRTSALQTRSVSPRASAGALSGIADRALLLWVVSGQKLRQIVVSRLLFPRLYMRVFPLLSSVFAA